MAPPASNRSACATYLLSAFIPGALLAYAVRDRVRDYLFDGAFLPYLRDDDPAGQWVAFGCGAFLLGQVLAVLGEVLERHLPRRAPASDAPGAKAPAAADVLDAEVRLFRGTALALLVVLPFKLDDMQFPRAWATLLLWTGLLAVSLACYPARKRQLEGER